MTQILCDYMFEEYPDPGKHLVLCGEASLDSTWPLNKPGVPSIRMIHNHFMVFPVQDLVDAEHANPNDPNPSYTPPKSARISRSKESVERIEATPEAASERA